MATDGHGWTRIGIGSDSGCNWVRLRGRQRAGCRIPGEGLGTGPDPGAGISWGERQGSGFISSLLPRALRRRLRGRSRGGGKGHRGIAVR
jgi:hypothetical protein